MRVIIVCLSVFLFLSACKTKKPALTPDKPKAETKAINTSELALLNEIEKAKNKGEALRFEADADYKEGKNDISLHMELVTKNDTYIWMGVKAFGIVNVARVLIKPDSIRILDLVNKKYISASYNYLGRFTSAPLSFKEMQNLVWGNALFDPIQEKTSYDSTQLELVLKMILGEVTQKASYNKEYKTKNVWLTEQGLSREMAVKYDNLKTVGSNRFPSTILINIEAEKNVECKFSLSNFAYDVKQDPAFNIPRSYKVEVFR